LTALRGQNRPVIPPGRGNKLALGTGGMQQNDNP
jgi:hypothetical protein